MKKLLAIFMVAVIGVSFTACSKKLGVITSSTMASSETVSNAGTSSQQNYVSSEASTLDMIIVDFSSGYGCTHDYDFATCTMPRSCVLCGAVSGNALGHSWKSATCTTAKTCKRCGQTEGKALGHSWKDATCTDAKTCKNCGATAGTALGHQFSSATCISPQICSRCGTTSGNALGHNYSLANCYSPKTCTLCGQTSGSALGHKYNKGECTVCGSTDPETTVYLYDMDMFDSQNKVDKAQNKYDTYGNFYDKVIQFGDQNNWYNPDPIVTYRLAGNYSKFEGTIGYYDSNKSGYDNLWMDGNLTIKIYRDSEMIYMKDNITKWTEPIIFSLDISSCNFLKIEVINTKDEGNAYLLLGNAVVKK